MLRAVSRQQLGKHVARSGLVRVPARTNPVPVRTNITVSRQQLINPQIRNRSLGHPSAKTPKTTAKSFTTQSGRTTNEWPRPPKKPRRAGVCARLLKRIFNRNGFSKAFSFLAGILLRAPGVAVLRFIALRFASGPPALKAVGAFILAVLGITAAGEERLPAPLPVPELPTGVQVQKEREIPIPRDWQIQSAGDVRMRRVELNHYPLRCREGYVDKYLERVMHDTSHNKCVGVDGTGLTKSARVLKVERIENMRLWKTYWHRKREMLDSHRANRVRVSKVEPMPSAPMLGPKSALDQEQLLEPGLNETFLFHGTSVEVAGIVAEHGFDERVASMQGLYGLPLPLRLLLPLPQYSPSTVSLPQHSISLLLIPNSSLFFANCRCAALGYIMPRKLAKQLSMQRKHPMGHRRSSSRVCC